MTGQHVPRPAPAAPRRQQITVAVLVVILTVRDGALQVLLIRRSAEPFKDQWALPGGVLDQGESLDLAAARKLVEETGVADVYLEQLYTFSGLDPRPDTGSVAVTYFALVDPGQAKLAQRNEWQPAWHRVADLPPLAFENRRVVEYALRRLRAKLEYSNVAYSLLPEEFTMSQLQAVYESILARRLDKRNFRKRMLSLGIIRPTGRRYARGAGRPAQLYAFTARKPTLF
ncbi:MAG TPA: NUDIX domain-containing protein [Dehalococcoidia bacterium]